MRAEAARLAAWVAGSRGWRRIVLALMAGLLAFGALPPFNLAPLLIPSFTLLIWLVEGSRTLCGAFGIGWVWGMGCLVPSLYWTALSMLVDIDQFWWLIPCDVLGLPAFLALSIGGATTSARILRRWGLNPVIALAVPWTVFEWQRGHVPFGGFPWSLVGQTWSSDATVSLAFLQTASLVGLYGLGFLTILVAGLPALVGYPNQRRPGLLVSLGYLAFAGVGLWGAYRLSEPDPMVSGITIRLVGTDYPQNLHQSPAEAGAEIRHTFDLMHRPPVEGIAAVILPESGIDYPLNLSADARNSVLAAAPPGAIVLTGSIHENAKSGEAWNALIAIGAEGTVLGLYDKHNLVPFGEYVPLRSIIPLNPIVLDRRDWSTGPGPQTLMLPGLPPVGPMICYEAIFAHDVVDEDRRPGWMLNVTNDSWFGDSIGPPQHFALARIRAVEEGLPLVRVANGGVTGVVDGHGRLTASLPIATEGILDTPLPIGLKRTLYGRFSDVNWLVVVLFFLIASIYSRNRLYNC